MYIVKTSSNLNSVITPKRLLKTAMENDIEMLVVANDTACDWLELEERKRELKSEIKIIYALEKEYSDKRVIWMIKGDVLKNASQVEKSLEQKELSKLSPSEVVPVIMFDNETDIESFKNIYKELFKEVGDAYIGVDSELTRSTDELGLKDDRKLYSFQKVDYIDPTEKEMYDIKKRDSGELSVSNRYDSFLKPEAFLNKKVLETKNKLKNFESEFKVSNSFSASYWDKEEIKRQPIDVDWDRFFKKGYKLPDSDFEKRKVFLLCKLAGIGFNKVYTINPDVSLTPEQKEERLERLKYELTVIVNGGFYEYFIIIADIVHFGESNGIRMGHRGSVVGSVVAYTLGITKVDPFEYDLIFERFLNPHRSGRPDIDLEVPANHLDKIFTYIREKYKDENVCKVISSNRYGFRDSVAVIRKEMGIEESLEKEFTGMGTDFNAFKKTEKGKEALKKIYYGGHDVVVEMAEQYQHLPQSKSVQQGSIVIDDKIKHLPTIKMDGMNVLPLTNSNEDLFKLALDKIDILSSKNLDVIEKSWEYVGEKGKKSFNYEDPKTFELLSNGNKNYVFQLKSKGIKDAFEKIKPRNVKEIMAGISLYRPGPIREIDNYINNKNKGSFEFRTLEGKPIKGSEIIKPIIEETHGIIIYQEQIMQIAAVWSGYSDSEADLFRTIVSDKKDYLMKKEKEKFVNRALSKGRDKKASEDLFLLIEKFSNYGFPKSHAASYSLLTYETAYLKANYPVHFFLALLNSNLSVNKVEFKKNGEIIEEMKKEGFIFDKPNYKTSNGFYKYSNNKVIPGILSIKGISRKDIRYILNSQKKMIENEKTKQKEKESLKKKVRKITYDTLESVGYFN